MTDFDITVQPGVIWDDLNNFNEDMFEQKFEINKNEGKHIHLSYKEEGAQDLIVKVKFFELPGSENSTDRIRVRFVKKSGELDKWYSIFNDMKESILKDVLCAPEQPDLLEVN
jgi:hypothetical protein